MMKIRRLIASALTLAMLFTMNTTAFATTDGTSISEDIQISSFVDGEGKVNTVHISSETRGTAHVDYYIEDVLVNTVDVAILDLQEMKGNSLDSAGSVRINYTNVETSETKVFVDSISNYIAESKVSNGRPSAVEAAADAAYIYQGKINYNTYYTAYGEYTDQLYIYQKTGDTTYEYKTINAEEGTAASLVIGVIAAVLTVICPALQIFSTSLLYAAAYAAGTTIVGGIVQGAITKEYYVRTTEYDVKACDIVTSREQIYDAERYQVALTGGGYSSEYYYEGYLPWDTNAVAYWMFCDFWAYPYPGVSSYT